MAHGVEPSASTLPARPASRLELVVMGVTAAALLVFAATTLLRPDGSYLAWADVWVYGVAGLGAALVCAGRAARDRGGRLAWAALSVGLLGTAAGDVAYAVVVSRDPSLPYPSFADALYLAFFPGTYVGLLLLLRAAVPRFLASMWFDVVIGALGAAALAYWLVFNDLLSLSGGRVSVTVTNLAYPVGDMLLLVVAAAAVAAIGWRCGRGWWLLVAGLVCVATVDTVYAMQVSAGTYVEGTLLDTLWPLSGGLVALAALSPAPRSRPSRSAQAWWSELLVPGFFTGSSLLLLVNADGPGLGSYLAAGAILAAAIRAAMTFREVNSLADSRRQARTDELTGLTNRRAFNGDLARALSGGAGASAGTHVAVLLIDLDRFKEINDALGHKVGDDLLRLVGPRIARSLPSGAALARLGGDEFAILLTEHSGAADALDVGHRVVEGLAEPFELPEISLHVGASIGVAPGTVPDADAGLLLQQADVAMYDAKANGGGIRQYKPGLDLHSRDRLQTIEHLRAAIATDQLVLHYQPKICLTSGEVVGAEALVRWQHPDRGLLSPDQFLPLAEHTGLMRPLTAWVMEKALSQAQVWHRRGWDLSVAVNVSTSNLLDTALSRQVELLLGAYRLPARCIELEVTESTIMADPARAQEVVDDLRRLGVRVAVDDYGTGYSSLAYLRDLRVSDLKLDRSFVQYVAADERSAAIVRSTVDLAHSLGLRLVAEGVEDDAAAARLTELGCDIAQGYHYSPAVPAAQLDWWLRRDPLAIEGGQAAG